VTPALLPPHGADDLLSRRTDHVAPGCCGIVTHESHAVAALRGMTVMVLDGHRDTVDMLEEYLSACGATVVAAVSAKAALALAEAIVLDAALVDVRCPAKTAGGSCASCAASRTRSANAAVYASVLSGLKDMQTRKALSWYRNCRIHSSLRACQRSLGRKYLSGCPTP
jgi:CheY-like chemotaxis protein